VLLEDVLGGKGKGLAALPEVRRVFEGAAVAVTVRQSNAPGDLFAGARDADFALYDALCVLGGDGSIHEVLNGMCRRPDGQRLPLALVPCGTGNAFVTDFKAGSKLSPVASAQSILKGVAHTVDAGRVQAGAEEVFFFNMVNWPADYMQRAEGLRWMGPHRYKSAAFLDVMGGRMGRPVRMRIDDEEWPQEDVMLIHVQNNRTCGDGMRAVPTAEVDDGRLDMFFVPKCGRLALLTLLGQSNSGAHVNNPNTVFRRFRRLTIEALGNEPAAAVNVDGEVVGTDPLVLEVIPNAFEVIV